MNAEQVHNTLLLVLILFCFMAALSIATDLVTDLLRGWIERRKR